MQTSVVLVSKSKITSIAFPRFGAHISITLF